MREGVRRGRERLEGKTGGFSRRAHQGEEKRALAFRATIQTRKERGERDKRMRANEERERE